MSHLPLIIAVALVAAGIAASVALGRCTPIAGTETVRAGQIVRACR